jgi:hypothetical protein
VQPKVSVQREAVVETDEQVLATGIDVHDGAADDALEMCAARAAARGDDHSADEQRSENLRDPGERVALRHLAL